MSFILTLTGRTCAGKSTLEKALRNVGFEPIVSSTTRPPRKGESEGLSYKFIDYVEFHELISARLMVEHVSFGGHQYGITKAEMDRAIATGKPVVIVLEPQGLVQIKEYAVEANWNVFSVFVDNPDEVIISRFLARFISAYENDTNLVGLISVYAKRMAGIMSVEAGWRVWAYCEHSLYDLLLERFDESNMASVVRRLAEMSETECVT